LQVYPLQICILVLLFSPISSNWAEESKTKSQQQFIFGAYDPGGLLEQTNGISIDHVFVHWQAFDKVVFQHQLDKATADGRILMVTVEPFTHAANWRDGADHLFPDITSGAYDSEISKVCDSIGRENREVWVRWGHEMDDDQGGRYPWARQDPGRYVVAYRYFVSRCRRSARLSKYVWSPTGLRAVDQYYPGNDYVDFVGISLYSLEAWDLDNLGRPSSAAEVLNDRYRRVSAFGKPIIVAEVGVSGSPEYVSCWLDDLIKQAPSFPLLRAMVYFNDRETGNWERYGSPDWRISANLWQTLFSAPERK
jgi:beta-mannanase